jgi:hypothetical protein
MSSPSRKKTYLTSLDAKERKELDCNQRLVLEELLHEGETLGVE